MTWPVIARAQAVPMIGLLGTTTAQGWGGLTAAGGLGNDFRSRAVQTLTFVDCNPLLLMLSGAVGARLGVECFVPD